MASRKVTARDDVQIDRFESIEAYCNQYRKLGIVPYEKKSQDWSLGVPGTVALQKATEGDTNIAAKASQAIDKLYTSIGPAQLMTSVRAVAGTRVSVPHYLAGEPRAMMRRVKTGRHGLHVNVNACIGSSWQVSAENMFTRGCAIIGLVEALQRSNVSVQLYLLAETAITGHSGSLFQVISVPSPVDLSVSAFAAAHPAFSRNVTLEYGHHVYGLDKSAPFPYPWYRTQGGEPYYQFLRSALGMSPQDIYVPKPLYNDEFIMQDPAEWVTQHVNQLKESYGQ